MSSRRWVGWGLRGPAPLHRVPAAPQYVKKNKEDDNDWFKLESNADGTRWFGTCWTFLDGLRYEFDVEFDVRTASARGATPRHTYTLIHLYCCRPRSRTIHALGPRSLLSLLRRSRAYLRPSSLSQGLSMEILSQANVTVLVLLCRLRESLDGHYPGTLTN